MAYRTGKLCLIVSPVILAVVWANNNKPASVSDRLPPIETFLAKPIDLENINVWVPAQKTGPVINRSCRPKKNCSFSC